MNKEVYERLVEELPEAPLEYLEGKDPAISVKADDLFEVAHHLKEKQGYDYLSAVTGVDYPDRFQVIYHLYSMKEGKGPLILKVSASKDEPELPSVTPFWPGANFQEREVYDLMGIRFTGHPDLKRILLWEGYEGHPLRKDFPIEGYQTIGQEEPS
ncbi:MAG: NADH-quinone oxidoreductase subunit C [Anaerolineae bacterium]